MKNKNRYAKVVYLHSCLTYHQHPIKHLNTKYSKYFHIHETFTKYTHHALILTLINCNAFELHVLFWESQMGHGHPLIWLQPVQN